MRPGLLPALALLALTAARPAAADTKSLTVDHSAVACVVAGKHPVIAARFAPEEQVARARVYFRGGGQQRWYFVEMAAGDGGFRGTLPRPTLQLATVEYYVDALGRTLAEARTPEHAPRVVRDEAVCRNEPLALLLDEARVVVGGGSDGASVPQGFSAEGVVTARTAATSTASKGGGISGKTIGLGAAGLGAIGVAVAAGGGGGGDSRPGTPSGPSTPSASTPSTSAPGGTTVTYTANLFGPGWHRGDCSLPQDLNAQFTPRASGRADLTLSFPPRVEQMLSLAIAPAVPVASGSAQGPGPSVAASYQVQAGTAYTVRVCVPVGPALDPGPFAVTLTIVHP